jgi:predicted nucleic acid-binding protein
MNRIFVDTSAWDAIADGGDTNHGLALLFRNEIAGHYKLVTTNYVLDELYTLLLLNIGYRQTIRYKRQLDILIQEGILEFEWISEQVAAEAWAIFEQFNTDKQWSFTDCTSYVVMKRLGIAEVFAFDRHFEQMGFIRRP